MIKLVSCLFMLSFLGAGLLLVIPTNPSIVQASAETNEIPKPSVPEFTVDLVDNSYDVPTDGYHVENKLIELRIKNQPFIPYVDEHGNEINLHFNVRVKKPFETGWTELNTPNILSFRDGWSYETKIPPQSSSEDTVYVYSADYPDGAQLDYQVRAQLGYYTEYYPYVGVVASSGWSFHGEFSDWSGTQTLTIPPSSPLLPETPSTEFELSVPEFTVALVANPYDVPSTTTTQIDQYTGKETVITTPGYHVENKSIEVVIENQPFTSYTDEDGHEINLYYDVQVKGHFGDDWTSVGSISSYPGGPQSNAQLDSEYTIISIEADDYPSDAVLDFRVQALVGYYVAYGRCTVIFGWDFYGQVSGWGDTQTLSLNSGEVIPEFQPWIILPLLLVATAIVAIQKKRLTKTVTHNP